MAITTLSSLSTTVFKGGKGLSGSGSTALVGRLNTVIAKVNELLNGFSTGALDTLIVGTVGAGTYYGTSDSWMSIDGTNPPTFSRIRLLDETTGLYVTVRANAGALEVL